MTRLMLRMKMILVVMVVENGKRWREKRKEQKILMVLEEVD